MNSRIFEVTTSVQTELQGISHAPDCQSSVQDRPLRTWLHNVFNESQLSMPKEP